MLGAESKIMDSVTTPAPKIEVTPDSKDRPKPERVEGMIQNLRLLAKRFHLNNYIPFITAANYVHSIPTSSFVALENLDSEASRQDGKLRTGMRHLTAPFRLWHGTPHFHLYGPQDATAVYRPGQKRTFDRRFIGRDRSSGALSNVWRGPYEWTSRDVGLMTMKLPFTTIFNSLLLPKNKKDIGEEYNPGFVHFAGKAQEDLYAYVSFGDDMRLSQLYCVPFFRININLNGDIYTTQPSEIIPATIRVVGGGTKRYELPQVPGIDFFSNNTVRTGYYGGVSYQVSSVTIDTEAIDPNYLSQFGYIVGPNSSFTGPQEDLSGDLSGMIAIAPSISISTSQVPGKAFRGPYDGNKLLGTYTQLAPDAIDYNTGVVIDCSTAGQPFLEDVYGRLEDNEVFRFSPAGEAKVALEEKSVLFGTKDGMTQYIELQMGLVQSNVRNVNIENAISDTMDIASSTDTFETTQNTDATANVGGDRPNIGTTGILYVQKKVPYGSNGHGITMDQVMALKTGVIGPSPMNFCTSVDEMAFQHLLKHNYSKTHTLTEASAPGDIIASGLICPCPDLVNAVAGNLTLKPFMLEYISSLFKYWQGDLSWKFQFIIPQAATARLAFVTQYGEYTIPTRLPEQMSQYATVFDINSNNMFYEAEVKYRSPYQRLEIPNGNVSDLTRVATGTWALVVVNRLRVPENCANSIEINEFPGAGADFKLSTYGAINYSIEPIVVTADRPINPTSSSLEKKSEGKVVLQMQAPPDQDSKVGVTFLEDKPSGPVQSNNNGSVQEEKHDAVMPENQLNVVEMAMRPQNIATFLWETSQDSGAVLFSGRVPWDFVGFNNLTPFEQFNYFRGGLELIIKVQATAFHAGSLICYFVPLTSDGDVAAHHHDSKASQTICNHQFLYATESNTVNIKIPFVQIRSWLDTRDLSVDEGAFRIQVFNPLTVGANGTPSATVNVFASFYDCAFKVLNPQYNVTMLRESRAQQAQEMKERNQRRIPVVRNR